MDKWSLDEKEMSVRGRKGKRRGTAARTSQFGA